MPVLQLTVSRIISIYVAQGILLAFFIYLAYKTLKQGKRRLTYIFSCFYLSVVAGILVNFIYAPLTDPGIVKVLNSLTNYFISLGSVFLAVFCLTFYLGEEKFNTPKQVGYIAIYAFVLIFMVIIPEGVTIGPETGWSPQWSWPYFVYVMTSITIITFIPTIIVANKLFDKFEDAQLKKKWKFFIIGFIELYILLFGTFFTNALADPSINFYWSLVMFALALTGGYAIYYGIAKRF